MLIKTILITGGAGFIGSALCRSLLLINYKVICLDNFEDYYSPEKKRNNINSLLEDNNFILEKGDIRDIDFLNETFLKHSINSVVHLAGKGGVRNSIENASDYYDVNVVGSINLLEIMKKHSVTNFIFASSSSVYGDNDQLLKEGDCTDFQISPYAATKKTVELASYNYYKNYRFKIINLRLFSVYGNNQRPDLFINKVFSSLVNSNEIEIYGDGFQKRDFTHLDDVLVAIHKALSLLEAEDNIYEIINIGSHNPISVNALIKTIEKEVKTSLNYKYIPKQDGDVQATYADISKAKRILNYTPKISLSQGINEYYIWFKNNENVKNT